MHGVLFVYGTLMVSRRMDEVLGGAAHWTAIGRAAVRGVLYDLGDYPGLRLAETSALVPGLLLAVDPADVALALLDEYEGVAQGLFARRRVAVERAPPHRTAWTYEYQGGVDGLRRLRSWRGDFKVG